MIFYFILILIRVYGCQGGQGQLFYLFISKKPSGETQTHLFCSLNILIREPSQITFAFRGGQVVSKMLTYVYIGSVGPFRNVHINKKNVIFSLFHFATFYFGIFYRFLFQVIHSRAELMINLTRERPLMTSNFRQVGRFSMIGRKSDMVGWQVSRDGTSDFFSTR